MGRKSLIKERKANPEKKMEWVKQLLPVLQQGVKDISMDEVAALLKISKATLYKYFHSKEEILLAAMDYKLEQIGHYEAILFSSDSTFLERYFKAIQILLMHLAGVSNNFLAELQEMYPVVWQRVERFQEESTEKLKEFYRQGIDQKIIKNINPAILVLSDKLFFAALSNPAFLMDNKLTIHQAFEDYFQMKLNGMIRDEENNVNIRLKVQKLLSDGTMV